MSTNFVKYCLLCGQENLSIASFCEKCDADLMNTAVEMRRDTDTANNAVDLVEVEDTTPAPVTPGDTPQTQPNNNHSHDENEVATRRASQAPGAILELELVANPAIRFSIRPGQTVGRSNRADVVLNGVPELEFISRAHARFTQRRTQWYVQYIAEGNSITVDGVESQDDAEVAIYDQSIVVLSFTAFRIKLP